MTRSRGMEDEASSPNAPQFVTIQKIAGVQRREAWVGWTQVVANVLVPLAIAITAFSLLLQSWEGRRDTAARQIEMFYSEGMATSQTILFSLWDRKDISVLRVPQNRKFVDSFVARSIEASEIDRGEINRALMVISAFFDRIESCVESRRCDEGEIMAHLGRYGRDFYCIYVGQIEELKDDSLVIGLGDGLAQFANRSGGCGR